MYLVYFIHDFDGWTDKGILIGLFESLDDIDYSKIHQILIDEIFKHITENGANAVEGACPMSIVYVKIQNNQYADYIFNNRFYVKELKVGKTLFQDLTDDSEKSLEGTTNANRKTINYTKGFEIYSYNRNLGKLIKESV